MKCVDSLPAVEKIAAGKFLKNSVIQRLDARKGVFGRPPMATKKVRE